jgi:hypothetical protein
MIGRTDRWWQAMTKTAKNPEERLMCIQDILKSTYMILKKTKPKIPRKKKKKNSIPRL